MGYDSSRYRRRSIRLRGYDYRRPGAYFVTICTRDRECVFGRVVDGRMRHSSAGKATHRRWLAIPDLFSQAMLDAFVVMPNHVHGVVGIVGKSPMRNPGDYDICRGLINQPPTNIPNTQHAPDLGDDSSADDDWILMKKPGQGLGKIVRAYKARVTRHIRKNIDPGFAWQRNYFERIVRNEDELERIRWYIRHNPRNWMQDVNHPDRIE